MPKNTDKFRLGYFVAGELTDPETESRRWNTVDSLLRGLYLMVGDGVASGWNLTAGTGLSVDISTGRGVISQVAVSSPNAFTLSSLVPNSDNLIYAILTPSSYWDASVTFQATIEPFEGSGVLIGKVTTDSSSVTSIDSSVRNEIGIVNGILEAVANHRHNGASGNPSAIDLSSEVQGILSQANIPELDAGKINRGTLPDSVIPKIDHSERLTNVGSLTHSELDSLAETLSNPNRNLIGETALVNFLQLLLSLKPGDPDIDQDMVNEIAFIPGYSPDGMVDVENTTAVVDNVNHKITVSAAGSTQTFTRSWNQDTIGSATLWQTVEDGGLLRLQPTEQQSWIEDFEDVSDWEVRVVDLSSDASLTLTKGSGNTGILNLNNGVQGNISLFMEKEFATQDWTSFSRIIFSLNTADLDHGDIYFYLTDGESGQSEKVLVLEAGAPTVNQDTLLNGWREISVDISSFSRAEVQSVGFTTSTEGGWDPSRSFALEVGEIYLTTGNLFKATGTATFFSGTEGFPVIWSAIRWTASNPSDSNLKFRWRQANNSAGLSLAAWSDYDNSGTILTGNTDPYALIEVEATLEASSDSFYSPEIIEVQLQWDAMSTEDAFDFNSQEQWLGGTLENIDAVSTPDSIAISGIDDVAGITYAKDGSVIRADDTLATLATIAGTSIPKSTNQVVNGEAAGLGQISGFDFGSNGSFWVADTDNDRVLQLAADGSLLCGLYGSFLEEPADPYGYEERGPGSNTDAAEITAATESSIPPVPLHAIYNPNTGKLSVIFDGNLEQVHDDATTLDATKFHLTAATHRVYFGTDTTFSLFGIDGAKLDAWINTGNTFLPQFKTASHILQVQLSQRDQAALGSIVDFGVVGLTCASPTVNQIFSPGSVSVNLVSSNVTIGAEGVTLKTNLKRPTNLWDGWVSRTSGVFTLTGLTAGRYELAAKLVDANGADYSNAEASLVLEFGVTSVVQAAVCVSTPVANQRFPGDSVSIEFTTPNFTVLPAGPHLRYRVDGGPYLPWRTTHSLDIEDLSIGSHTVDLYLATDDAGTPSASPDADTSLTFHCGASSLSSLKLYIGEGALRGASRAATTIVKDAVVPVDSANIYLANIYAPIEVQYLPDESSIANPTGEPTVMVGKLRSPSSTSAMSTTTPFASTGDATADKAIFGTNYLDGHSAGQFTLGGELVFSNNAAKFAETREESKTTLGSVQKIGTAELLLGDAVRKRAIIAYTDLSTEETFVSWEYLSDRSVTDFRLEEIAEQTIVFDESGPDNAELVIRSGTTVIWRNDAAVPMTIYSGNVSTSQFNEDPDLTLYGDVFTSQELASGEEYSFTFDNPGDFHWFAYPGIANAEVNGIVRVSSGRISPSDTYLLVENDLQAETVSGRVIKIDAWGNVQWTYGEGILHQPRDVRPMPDGTLLIST